MQRTLTWRKSTYSGDPNGDCVEVARAEVAVLVRDSKNAAGPVLAFPVVQWRAFLNARHQPSPDQQWSNS